MTQTATKLNRKQVRETAAGQSISAWVVLNKDGQHIANVQAHYSNGGTCAVDIWGVRAEGRCLFMRLRNKKGMPQKLATAYLYA